MSPSTQSGHSLSFDVLIAGAGIIGLALALELRRRGASVAVLDRGAAMGGASTAAAGMLAAEDPHNPAALLEFSRYSLRCYPDLLGRIQELSGQSVPFQTEETIQYAGRGKTLLREHSIDPRQLGPALLAATKACGAHVLEHTEAIRVFDPSQVKIQTAAGLLCTAGRLVHTTGAWLPRDTPLPVTPRKGQMLRVALPPDASLQQVHRAEHIYIVPRTTGPQAGSALLGATVEDAGFDLTVNPLALQQLRADAARLAPETAFAEGAPLLESWAGLRPSTPDLLPLVGQLREREWVATGHYRNGILLAPGTAVIVSRLLSGQESRVDLTPFAPARFQVAPASSRSAE